MTMESGGKESDVLELDSHNGCGPPGKVLGTEFVSFAKGACRGFLFVCF